MAMPWCDVASPSLDYRALYVHLRARGWWFGRGIEAQDYCG